MLFSDVLSLHHSVTAEDSRADILGDAFLLRENPIYRRIRRRALEIGVTFNEATAGYLLMPFNALDAIVASKSVPYVPSARLMAEIEARSPGAFDLERMPIPESYHLHESAHVLAEHCCAGVTSIDQEDRILRAILCESFANAADAIACSYADSAIHRVFLKLNCYMLPTEANQKQMIRVREALGEAVTVRLVLLSYLFANFLREDVPIELIEAQLGSPPSKKVMKDCVALSGIGQRLDPLFRVRTTENYFQLQGFRGEIYDLLDFDIAERLQAKPFQAAFASMAAELS